MKFLTLALSLLLSTPAFAGFQGINGTTNLGIFNKVTCSTGLTCTKVKDAFSIVSSPTISTGALTISAAASTSATLSLTANAGAANADKWQLVDDTSTDSLFWQNKTSGSFVTKSTLTTAGVFSTSGGVAQSTTAPMTIWHSWTPTVVTQATSATPSATVVYMTQVYIPTNTTITGVGVLNAATVGTNKYVVALFDDAGNALANSATAGVTTSGASAYQKVALTAPYSAVGPRTIWVGVYVNGTTDRYYAVPTVGQDHGLAGSVSGQTFGTVAAVTLPTTFTADVGPVVYTY